MEAILYDTADLPPDARFASWAQGMAFYDVATDDPAGFQALISAWRLAPLIVVDAVLGSIRFARTPERIGADRNDDLVVMLIDTGSFSGIIDGVELAAGPGELVLLDRRQPMPEVRMAAGRNIALSLPRSSLEEALPNAQLGVRVLSGGLAGLLAAALRALPAALAEAEARPAELSRLLRDLLTAAVRGSPAPTAALHAAAVRARVRRHINVHLAARLDVPTLCAELGISRSALYRAFAQDGGVARFVQTQRLGRLHQALRDPAEARPIARLAAELGFLDYAHCSRLFRRAYGRSPQRVRLDARGPPTRPEPVVAESAPHAYNLWEARRG